MAYSKTEIKNLKEMIADDSISEKEKDMYRELLKNNPKAKSKSKSKKKPATKKSKAEAEKELAKKVGKTEEECEDILEQYKSLRSKAKARTKKATKTKAKAKAQGKTEPSGEKTPQAEIETATEKVEKKIEKKIEKVEKAEKPKADATPKAKVEAKKKVEKVVEKVADESLDAVADMVKAIMSSLAKYDKVVAKKELIKLRDALNKEIAKYGDGGMVKGYDIQASLINVGNNPSYAKGGKVAKVSEIKKRFEDYTDEELQLYNGDNEETLKDWNREDSIYGAVVIDINELQDDGYEIQDDINYYAKGGKTQGYNDKDDESIGMRNKGKKSQSRKSRRDESAGMEKAGGRRKYADVGTMDNFTSSIDLGRFQKMKNRGMFGGGGDLGNIAKPYNIQEGMISVGNNVKFFKKGGKTKKDWVQKVTDSPNFKKGAFTKKADNRGMTTKAFMKEVLSNPDNYTLKTRRQAQFMKNVQ